MNAFGYVVIPGIPNIIPRSDRITSMISAAANEPRTIAKIVRTLSHLKSLCKVDLMGKTDVHIAKPKIANPTKAEKLSVINGKFNTLNAANSTKIYKTPKRTPTTVDIFTIMLENFEDLFSSTVVIVTFLNLFI